MLSALLFAATAAFVFVYSYASDKAVSDQRSYVRIAEALSSPSLNEGIVVAPRMFTAPQLMKACQDVIPMARLRVVPATLQLTRGVRYTLSSLSVVAVNAADVEVPGVPLTIEAEDSEPPVLVLRSDDPDLDAGRLHALAPGRFRMRVRTICGVRPVEAVIDGIVQ